MNEIEIRDNPAMIAIATTPHDIIARAQEQAQALIDVVEKQKMYQLIRGKKFPQVEAWQLLAAFTGLTAKVEWSKRLDYEDEIAYEARVIVLDKEGKEVCAGESECSNTEEGKQKLTANQIRSTAQTRAVSKAYRLKLSFIMKLAGYEATSSEEIDSNGFPEKETQAPTTKQTPPTKTKQAPEKVAKAEPKPERNIGISKEEFREVQADCLRYVNEEIFKQIAEELDFKGKKLSEYTQEDLVTLLITCKNFQEEQAEQSEEEEPIEPFPIGEKEENNVKSEDTNDFPF